MINDLEKLLKPISSVLEDMFNKGRLVYIIIGLILLFIFLVLKLGIK